MNENIDKLIMFKTSNPELEVIAMVYEGVYSGDFGWDVGTFGKVEVNEYWQDDERIYRDDGIVDALSDYFSNDPESEGLSEEEFDAVIDKEMKRKRELGEIKEAIFVEII